MKSISKHVLLRLVAQSEEADIRGNCKLASDITTQLTKLAVRNETDESKYSYMKDEMLEDVKDHLWAAVVRIMDYYEEVPDAGVIQELVNFETETFVESVENFIKNEIGKHEGVVPGEDEDEDVDEDSEEVDEFEDEVAEEEEIVSELEEQEFELAFDTAFDKLRASRPMNLVELSALRKSLPEFDRAEFDAGLRQLRIEKRYSLQTFDGRHGKLSAEDLDAAINEDGRIFHYVSKRD